LSNANNGTNTTSILWEGTSIPSTGREYYAIFLDFRIVCQKEVSHLKTIKISF
jgi:hypothetical protein